MQTNPQLQPRFMIYKQKKRSPKNRKEEERAIYLRVQDPA